MSLARKNTALATLLFALTTCVSTAAFAGGLEMPDHGTEALGRGGAFTAKADDPTAVYYNVAGLAEQRGTRLLANANASQSSLRFERAGNYAEEAGVSWSGKKYPAVDNQGGPVVLPFLAATSDLGLSWMTVALAAYAPPVASYSGRTYPLAVDGAPSPARYDAVGGTSSVIMFYTGAMAFKLGDSIDIGVAVHAVQATIETRTVSYLDLSQCKSSESQQCDGRSDGKSSGWTATGSVGALARLGKGVSAGLNVRGPVLMQTVGEAMTTSPRALGGTLSSPYRVGLRNAFPLVARAGLRKAWTKDRGQTEVADVELDVTYERWSDAQAPGPQALLERLGGKNNVNVSVVHNYVDTFSLRLGGAYNLSSLPLTLRAGTFYDASATQGADTRVDADTLAKVAGTLGMGLKVGSFGLNIAYAGVYDVPRTVSDGRFRPINAARGGTTNDVNGNPLPAVNNGAYSGFTHVVSLGVTVEIDKLMGFGRGAPSSPPSPAAPVQGRSGGQTTL